MSIVNRLAWQLALEGRFLIGPKWEHSIFFGHAAAARRFAIITHFSLLDRDDDR